MRTISLEEWKSEAPTRMRAAVRAGSRFEGRAVGRRPRDSEKEKVLTRMDRSRRARYIESGKLAVLGPRHWRWRIDFA